MVGGASPGLLVLGSLRMWAKEASKPFPYMDPAQLFFSRILPV